MNYQLSTCFDGGEFVNQRCVVVIPIYKVQMSRFESISLLQCSKVLSNHDVYYIAPFGFDYKQYRDIFNAPIKYYDKKYFQNISGYNNLMMTKNFYESFLEYDYMLIYQLDGFCFSDGVGYFMSLGYDYIGAPWLDGMNLYTYNFKGCGMLKKLFPKVGFIARLYVGNGGVSLRKIDSIIAAFNAYEAIISQWRFNEDILYSYLGEMDYSRFKVADVSTALKFSFEMSPSKCFQANEYKLPCFCHAWWKYDMDFWKPFFYELGYEI